MTCKTKKSAINVLGDTLTALTIGIAALVFLYNVYIEGKMAIFLGTTAWGVLFFLWCQWCQKHAKKYDVTIYIKPHKNKAPKQQKS